MNPRIAYEMAYYDPLKFKLHKEELESVIATSPEYSLMYVREFIPNMRVKLFENAIMQDSKYTYMYVLQVLKRKREEVFDNAMRHGYNWTWFYIEDIVCDRFELGEHTISFSKFWISHYRNIIKKDEDKTSFYYKII